MSLKYKMVRITPPSQKDLEAFVSRKSTCNCPFAEGRKVICKHMIALLFTAEPKAAEEAIEQQHYEDLQKCVRSLSNSELQEQLFDALVELEERRNYYW